MLLINTSGKLTREQDEAYLKASSHIKYCSSQKVYFIEESDSGVCFIGVCTGSKATGNLKLSKVFYGKEKLFDRLAELEGNPERMVIPDVDPATFFEPEYKDGESDGGELGMKYFCIYSVVPRKEK